MEEPREIAERGTILRCQVGSGLHGTAVAGTDDRDEMGICIAPPRYAAGLASFEQYVHRTAWERTGTHLRSRNQPRSQTGDLDLVVYDLRKWMRLALAANPTVLLPLFAPPPEYVTLTPLGRELLARESPLPSSPDADAVDEWLVSAHLRVWMSGAPPAAG